VETVFLPYGATLGQGMDIIGSSAVDDVLVNLDAQLSGESQEAHAGVDELEILSAASGARSETEDMFRY
jgi:hypothetical protein